MKKETAKITLLCEPSVETLFNQSLPEPELLDYYNRFSNREIFINDFVDDLCVEYAKFIMDWNRADKDIPIEERKTIKIYITYNNCYDP